MQVICKNALIGGSNKAETSMSFFHFFMHSSHRPLAVTCLTHGHHPSVFVIEASEPEVPEGLISILKLLRLSTEEWTKTKSKNKPPKSSLDSPSATAALLLLDRRLAEYPTTFEVYATILL
jgi:hypothetical protein